MKTTFKCIGLAAAAVVLAAECALIPAVASAAERIFHVGPPTQSTSFGEYNYAPGATVFLCINQSTGSVRGEIRTDVPYNCAAGEVQLPVTVAGSYPTPAP